MGGRADGSGGVTFDAGGGEGEDVLRRLLSRPPEEVGLMLPDHSPPGLDLPQSSPPRGVINSADLATWSHRCPRAEEGVGDS